MNSVVCENIFVCLRLYVLSILVKVCMNVLGCDIV